MFSALELAQQLMDGSPNVGFRQASQFLLDNGPFERPEENAALIVLRMIHADVFEDTSNPFIQEICSARSYLDRRSLLQSMVSKCAKEIDGLMIVDRLRSYALVREFLRSGVNRTETLGNKGSFVSEFEARSKMIDAKDMVEDFCDRQKYVEHLKAICKIFKFDEPLLNSPPALNAALPGVIEGVQGKRNFGLHELIEGGKSKGEKKSDFDPSAVDITIIAELLGVKAVDNGGAENSLSTAFSGAVILDPVSAARARGPVVWTPPPGHSAKILQAAPKPASSFAAAP